MIYKQNLPVLRVAPTPIVNNSVVDGPGTRTVLFMQGCSIHCPGCQSVHLWSELKGTTLTVEQVTSSLLFLSQKIGNITISGGEPFDQAQALAHLVRGLKREGRHVIVYTGYTLELLLQSNFRNYLWSNEVLERIDILVDGRFEASQDDNLIAWCGSRNQRPIDMQASMREGRIVTLPWDAPRVMISNRGTITAPVGLSRALRDIGPAERSRMCGQSKDLPK